MLPATLEKERSVRAVDDPKFNEWLSDLWPPT